MKPLLFRGQGIVKVAAIDPITGAVGGYRRLGNVPSLKLSMKTEMIEHQEYMTGKNQNDLRFYHSPKLDVAFDIEEFSFENVALSLWGKSQTLALIATPLVTSITAPEAGLDYKIGRPGCVVVSVEDSAVAPNTMAPTAYKVNADGTITFSQAGIDAMTGEVHVEATQPATEQMQIMADEARDVALIFQGLNTVNGNKPVTIDLGRLSLMPAKEFDVISKNLNKLSLEGAALYDPQSMGSGLLEGYGTLTFGA
jgi:hypothetical protein